MLSSSLITNPALFRVDIRGRVFCLNLRRFLVSVVGSVVLIWKVNAVWPSFLLPV